MKKLLIFIFCLLFALPISVIGLATEDENTVKTKLKRGKDKIRINYGKGEE